MSIIEKAWDKAFGHLQDSIRLVLDETEDEHESDQRKTVSSEPVTSKTIADRREESRSEVAHKISPGQIFVTSEERQVSENTPTPVLLPETLQHSSPVPESGLHAVAEALVSSQPLGVPGENVPGEQNFRQLDLDRTTKKANINWDMVQARGMLVPGQEDKQMAEEYRTIKRPLLMNAFPEEDNGLERANLILVTSSIPGEGKTFTAINLALSIAMERDKTVLLIDADVARPSVSTALGLTSEVGLTDLLKNPAVRFSDVVMKTNIPNLTLLPAGNRDSNSTELLASDSMRKLAKELSERYPDRIVIFDSPPILAASQGFVLASLVGQVVLVIEAGITPQYLVMETISKLGACDVIGCVLNKTKKGFGFNYYGYVYEYGNYYGNDSDDR